MLITGQIHPFSHSPLTFHYHPMQLSQMFTFDKENPDNHPKTNSIFVLNPLSPKADLYGSMIQCTHSHYGLSITTGTMILRF